MIKTTVIGSYPLLPDRHRIMKNYFRHRRDDPWSQVITEVITDMVKVGIDIVTDGQTRDPFIHLFARKLSGCRIRNRVEVIDEIAFKNPITRDDQKFVRSLLPPATQLKGVITGPYTLAQSCVNLYYKDGQDVAFAFARALSQEADSLQGHVDVLGIDEPFFSVTYPSYGKDLLRIVTEHVSIPTVLHVCGDISSIVPQLLEMPVDILSHEFKGRPCLLDVFKDYSFPHSLCLGSVRSDTDQIETVEEIVTHIQHALTLFGEKVVQVSPDCGQRCLPRDIAFKKLEHLVCAQKVVNG